MGARMALGQPWNILYFQNFNLNEVGQDFVRLNRLTINLLIKVVFLL